jgi:hypothetical protein
MRLVALLMGRRGDTEQGLVRQTSHHRLCLWDNRQHGLKQEAASLPVADWPQASHYGMLGQVDLRGLLHQEHHGYCLQAGTGLLPMWLHQRLKVTSGSSSNRYTALRSFQVFLLLGQRGCRIADYPTGGLDHAPGVSPIPQPCLPEGLLGPLVGMQ